MNKIKQEGCGYYKVEYGITGMIILNTSQPNDNIKFKRMHQGINFYLCIYFHAILPVIKNKLQIAIGLKGHDSGYFTR